MTDTSSPTASAVIGDRIGRARDAVARVLLGLGATPNRLTVLGFVVTLAAAVLLALGAGERHGGEPNDRGGHFLIAAGCCMFLAGALDMLDGAVARVGGQATRFGGFLDSTLDRFSDIALYAGIAVYYVRYPNVTCNFLAVLGMANALLISYSRARAEAFIPDCKVGYWERGERFVALMLGCFFHAIPTVLWQLATLPMLTAIHRLLYTYWAMSLPSGQAPPPLSLGARILFQDFKRGGLAYDFITAANIALILAAPITDEQDILGELFRLVVGNGR